MSRASPNRSARRKRAGEPLESPPKAARTVSELEQMLEPYSITWKPEVHVLEHTPMVASRGIGDIQASLEAHTLSKKLDSGRLVGAIQSVFDEGGELMWAMLLPLRQDTPRGELELGESSDEDELPGEGDVSVGVWDERRSVLGLFLRVGNLQRPIIDALFDAVSETVTESCAKGDVMWLQAIVHGAEDVAQSLSSSSKSEDIALSQDPARVMLRHLRWLPFVTDRLFLAQRCCDCLTSLCDRLILHLLELLPDIVGRDHESVTLLLGKIRDLIDCNASFLIPALNTASQLSLSPALDDSFISKASAMLGSCEERDVAQLIKVILENAAIEDTSSRPKRKSVPKASESAKSASRGAAESKATEDEDDQGGSMLPAWKVSQAFHTFRERVDPSTMEHAENNGMILGALYNAVSRFPIVARVFLASILDSTERAVLPASEIEEVEEAVAAARGEMDDRDMCLATQQAEPLPDEDAADDVQSAAAPTLKTLDVWMLGACSQSRMPLNKVLAVVTACCKAGTLTPSGVRVALEQHCPALAPVHTGLVTLFCALLRSPTPSCAALGCAGMEALFSGSMSEPGLEQGVLHALVASFASGSVNQERDASALVLLSLTTCRNTAVASRVWTYREHLLSTFDFASPMLYRHARAVYDVLFHSAQASASIDAITYSSSSSSSSSSTEHRAPATRAAIDTVGELDILIKKQLANPNLAYQVLGIIGFGSMLRFLGPCDDVASSAGSGGGNREALIDLALRSAGGHPGLLELVIQELQWSSGGDPWVPRVGMEFVEALAGMDNPRVGYWSPPCVRFSAGVSAKDAARQAVMNGISDLLFMRDNKPLPDSKSSKILALSELSPSSSSSSTGVAGVRIMTLDKGVPFDVDIVRASIATPVGESSSASSAAELLRRSVGVAPAVSRLAEHIPLQGGVLADCAAATAATLVKALATVSNSIFGTADDLIVAPFILPVVPPVGEKLWSLALTTKSSGATELSLEAAAMALVPGSSKAGAVDLVCTRGLVTGASWTRELISSFAARIFTEADASVHEAMADKKPVDVEEARAAAFALRAQMACRATQLVVLETASRIAVERNATAIQRLFHKAGPKQPVPVGFHSEVIVGAAAAVSAAAASADKKKRGKPKSRKPKDAWKMSALQLPPVNWVSAAALLQLPPYLFQLYCVEKEQPEPSVSAMPAAVFAPLAETVAETLRVAPPIPWVRRSTVTRQAHGVSSRHAGAIIAESIVPCALNVGRQLFRDLGADKEEEIESSQDQELSPASPPDEDASRSLRAALLLIKTVATIAREVTHSSLRRDSARGAQILAIASFFVDVCRGLRQLGTPSRQRTAARLVEEDTDGGTRGAFLSLLSSTLEAFRSLEMLSKAMPSWRLSASVLDIQGLLLECHEACFIKSRKALDQDHIKELHSRLAINARDLLLRPTSEKVPSATVRPVLHVYLHHSSTTLEQVYKGVIRPLQKLAAGEADRPPVLTEQTAAVFWEEGVIALICSLRALRERATIRHKPRGEPVQFRLLRGRAVGERALAISSHAKLLFVDCTRDLPRRPVLAAALRQGRKFVAELSAWQPLVPALLRASVTRGHSFILEGQRCLRQLHSIMQHSKEHDKSLMKAVPRLRQACEQFVLGIRGVLSQNGMLDAYSVQNLRNRTVEGETLASQIEPPPPEDEEDEEEEEEAAAVNGHDDDDSTVASEGNLGHELSELEKAFGDGGARDLFDNEADDDDDDGAVQDEEEDDDDDDDDDADEDDV
jgi:hypothetical protein